MAPQLAGKRLEFLKKIVPGLSQVAVLWEPTNPGVALIFQQLQRDAHTLGLTVQSHEVRSRDDFETAFAAMTRKPPDALVVAPAPLTVTHDLDIAAFTLQQRLPAIAAWRRFPRRGGLMSYGANFADNFRRAAPYVDKILRGAKPSELPVEQPRKYELVINLKTAGVLGLTIPPALQLLADEIIPYQ
jgi:putative ABC transport system substrate-binding protein